MISGIGTVAPLGGDALSLIEKIELGQSAVSYMEGWNVYSGLNSLVAAPAELKGEKDIPRKNRRSMGRMGIFAVQASQQAITDAGLTRDIISSGRTGCIIGSTMGGAEAMNDTFEIMLPDKDLSKLSAMNFFRCVSHTAAMNVSQYFGIKGYVMATSAACASALQAMGTGYELIRSGKQDVLLCGGAEELHPIITGSFDILFATSTHYNDTPGKTPRPFDRDRDGLVCSEGSGILVLEEYKQAKRRKAKIYAEVIGYHTCGSGAHVSQSSRESMSYCMREALRSAEIKAKDVDYVNAHATATIHGDQEESASIKEVFGSNVPVSSFKGYIGHALGASGSIELIVTLLMMKKNKIYPTRNLDNVSDDCQGINHVMRTMDQNIGTILKNCFAFGGINASLVCRKVS